jgi:hypothetical protein
MQRKMDGGELAFCGGVVHLGERINPGLGSWIEECVRRAMEDRGLTYQPIKHAKKPRAKKAKV